MQFGKASVGLSRFFKRIQADPPLIPDAPPDTSSRISPQRKRLHARSLGPRRPHQMVVPASSTDNKPALPLSSPFKYDGDLPDASRVESAASSSAAQQQPPVPSAAEKARMAKHYIGRARVILGEDYQYFTTLIKGYKAKKISSDTMFLRLRDLLCTSEKRRSLLEGFETFVPDKSKSSFLAMVAEIRAQPISSGDQAHDVQSLVSKEPSREVIALQNSQDRDENAPVSSTTPLLGRKKKVDLVTGVEYSTAKRPKTLRSNSSIGSGSLSGSSDRNVDEDSPKSGAASSASCTSSGSFGHSSLSRGASSLSSGQSSCGERAATAEAHSSPFAFPTTGEGAAAATAAAAGPGTAAPFGDALSEMDTDASAADDEPFLKCVICQCRAQAPFSAKCGHSCCYTCWQGWLKTKLECPICKQRVRQKQLRKIFLS